MSSFAQSAEKSKIIITEFFNVLDQSTIATFFFSFFFTKFDLIIRKINNTNTNVNCGNLTQSLLSSHCSLLNNSAKF